MARSIAIKPVFLPRASISVQAGTMRRRSHVLYLLIYVDDIIVTYSSLDALMTLIARLSPHFSLKDLGPLNYFLGVEVLPTIDGIFLSQHKYVSYLLHHAGMSAANPSSTLLSTTTSLLKSGGTPLESPTEYKDLVGSLQHLSLTQPDVAFATNRLSQFMQQPCTDHWNALWRVLCCMAGSEDHGIHISATSPLTFHTCRLDKDYYSSKTGYLPYLGSSPISWSFKKQRSVARSSTEAEYKALAKTSAEVQRATLRVSFVSTDDQLADVLTKVLQRPWYVSFMSKLNLSFVPKY
ncbi:LOW QUALITY PROTEIN: hypothetical protein V2J09_015932 [Rumex salicifolius]